MLRQRTTPKYIFKYIRYVSLQKSLPPTISFESLTATSDGDKANLFNAYFHSVFTKSSYILSHVDLLPSPQSTLSDISISEDDVYSALVSLDPTKSMGIDGISPKLLKHCALALYQPLHHLFLLTFSQSYIPEEWRTHLITPILKSGVKSKVNNYRPISLLCSVSKGLEKIIYDKIISFVVEHIKAQFGFLQHRSTLHQLLTFTKYISDSFKNNAQTDVIYLDFIKAFDSVAHNELFAKLWSFGITGTNWKWFQAYLTSRRQCVHFNNITSELLPVLSGVPQGSVLGPILFLVFINDLPDSILSSQVTLFADDTKCFKSVHSSLDSYSLQQDIHRLSLWSRQWTLNFNEQKSPAAINNTYFIVNQFINKIIIETWVSLCPVISAGVPTTVIFCPMPTKCFIYCDEVLAQPIVLTTK